MKKKKQDKNINTSKKQALCDICGKPAVWAIRVLSRWFLRCKEHRLILSKEFQNYALYKGEWVLIWDVKEDFEKYGGWCKSETMDDARREGLKKLGIPLDDYL